MILDVKPVEQMNRAELETLLGYLKPSQMRVMLSFFAGAHGDSFDVALRMADGLTVGTTKL